jgi:hypothetical protein
VSTLKIHVRKCPECKDEFTVTGAAAGRKKHCSPQCKAIAQRGHEQRYQARKREEYNPWLWENTILEWNE